MLWKHGFDTVEDTLFIQILYINVHLKIFWVKFYDIEEL